MQKVWDFALRFAASLGLVQLRQKTIDDAARINILLDGQLLQLQALAEAEEYARALEKDQPELAALFRADIERHKQQLLSGSAPMPAAPTPAERQLPAPAPQQQPDPQQQPVVPQIPGPKKRGRKPKNWVPPQLPAPEVNGHTNGHNGNPS